MDIALTLISSPAVFRCGGYYITGFSGGVFAAEPDGEYSGIFPQNIATA
jgi:hypothetical protein